MLETHASEKAAENLGILLNQPLYLRLQVAHGPNARYGTRNAFTPHGTTACALDSPRCQEPAQVRGTAVANSRCMVPGWQEAPSGDSDSSHHTTVALQLIDSSMTLELLDSTPSPPGSRSSRSKPRRRRSAPQSGSPEDPTLLGVSL